MKKTLLAIGMLAMALSANAQTTITYVGEGAKFFVDTNALVYSGGNWMLDAQTAATVENKGNIMIVGDYVKGSSTNAAVDGQEFVNVYTGKNNYGQVQILSTQSTTNARMTVQKPAASSAFFDSFFPISIPFKENVPFLMRSFGKTEADFKGSCPVGSSCFQARYDMSLQKWNNSKIYYDAVPTAESFIAGDQYSLNLRSTAGLQSAMTGIINYKGTPAPQTYSQSAASVIAGVDETTFSNMGYNDWKDKINPYNEFYKTYMGDFSSTNKVTNKNVYRFGNPYTSNLDLTAVDGPAAWLTITNGGTNRTIKAATTDQLVKNVTVYKYSEAFDTKWDANVGSTVTSPATNSYYMAKFDGTNWNGNPEALFIRPMEGFNLNFPLLDPTLLGGTRIIHINVNLGDAQKTFVYPGTGTAVTITPRTASVSGKSVAVAGRSAASGKVATVSQTSQVANTSGFYQVEMLLVKDGVAQASPVYAVGANYLAENATAGTSSNKMFLYGTKEAVRVDGSQKSFGEFNSTNYVGKPIPVGFNGLAANEKYTIAFNLYEGSIFNNVASLSDGAFYIKDNKTNTVTKVTADKPYTFTADANMTGRLDLFWKEAPTGGTTPGTLATADTAKEVSSTLVYRDNAEQRLRMEKEYKMAVVEVYDMSGRLVNSYKRVSPQQDLLLNFTSNGVYVIKVTYDNSEVRTLKAIK